MRSKFLPFQRPPTFAAASSLLWLMVIAACVDEPSPPQAGGALPLQAYNHTNQTRDIHIEVLDPATQSVLLAVDETLAPKRTRALPMGLLGHGDYVLVAEAGLVTREANVQFTPSSTYFRFVVHEDVIGFQSG